MFSTGDKAIKRNNIDSLNHQVTVWEFEDFTLEWKYRMFAGNNAEKTNIGCYFYGTEGTFHMGWQDGWTFYSDNKNKTVIHQNPQLNKPDDQNIKALWANFLSSIKSRKTSVLDIEIGHRSSNVALLGNLSMKLGRSIDGDGEKEIILNDPEANKLLGRNYRGDWVYPS